MSRIVKENIGQLLLIILGFITVNHWIYVAYKEFYECVRLAKVTNSAACKN